MAKLPEEVLLGMIANAGGGGGGTSDYSQLTNKPQINGVTLSGDKSASDLSLASLDANGKVPAAQLPSYVDDVINGYLYEGHFYEDAEHQTEITGESGKIYVDLETNKTYRWSGLAFVEISESLALGETASTAYAGDKGKANADAINAIKDGQTIDSFADVESALADKVDKVTGKGLSTNDYTDADKAIVGGVTAALAGKQDALTAGANINMTGDVVKAGVVEVVEPDMTVYGNSTESGSKTYTIETTGVYEIFYCLSLQSTVSVTLPNNANVLFESDLTVSSHPVKHIVVELHEGDTVTIAQTPSQWNAVVSGVLKLDAISVVDVAHTGSIADNTITYTLPNDNKYYLVVGACVGKPTGNNAVDSTSGGTPDITRTLTGTGVRFRSVVVKGSDSPSFSFYGYDGGVASIIAYEIEFEEGNWDYNLATKNYVDTALSGKQDTLTFDSVPTDGSTNPVESNGVFDALAGKQNVFTSGDYLEMANGVLNVTKNKGNDLYSYKFITTSTSDQPRVKIQRYINGVFQSEETYNNDNVRVNPVTLDGLFTFTYGLDGYRWQYTLLANSHQHNAGEVVKWMYNVSVDNTESFDVVPQDTSKNLVLQEDLDAALATKANASDVTTALALKQDATDNNLQTTDKTIVGAVNELKSGLSTLDTEVNGDATTYPYADVITIEDAVPSNLADCNVKIEPVQDLHGYDKPWVGGAGKNKLPLILADIKSSNTEGTWMGNVYTINGGTVTVNTRDDDTITGIDVSGTFTATTYLSLTNFTFANGTNYVLNGAPNGSSFGTYFLSATIGADYGSGVNIAGDGSSNNVRIVIQSGTISTPVTFLPMIRLATETDATFAPYTNICPISGHTEASVQRDGRNLCPVAKMNTLNSDAFKLKAGTYTISFKMAGSDMYSTSSVVLRDDSNAEILSVGVGGASSGTVKNGQFTLQSEKTLHLYENNISADASGYYIEDIQIELGSTATPYVPYAGKTYTIALGDTIYGGTVDFDSGVMTVTHKYVDLGDYAWNPADDATNFWTPNIDDMEYDSSASGSSKQCTDYISDKYGKDGTCRISMFYNTGYSGYRCFIYADVNASGMTGAQFKTYITGTHVCYKLATPIELQLTPAQIQLLKGQNTLTASTGDISVTVNGVSGSIGQVQEQVNELAEDVNDHKERIEAVESGVAGLTNYQAHNDLNLEVPDRKNLLPLTLDYLKSINTAGTWTDNVYRRRQVAFTVNETNGVVTSIAISGTASGNEAVMAMADNSVLQKYAGMSLVLNGVTGGSSSTYYLQAYKYDGTKSVNSYSGDSDAFTVTSDFERVRLIAIENAEITDQVVYPMLRLESVTDSTFETSKPSVETRLKSVETKLPAAPTTDGTYNLVCTVASGTPTYSWVSTT